MCLCAARGEWKTSFQGISRVGTTLGDMRASGKQTILLNFLRKIPSDRSIHRFVMFLLLIATFTLMRVPFTFPLCRVSVSEIEHVRANDIYEKISFLVQETGDVENYKRQGSLKGRVFKNRHKGAEMCKGEDGANIRRQNMEE